MFITLTVSFIPRIFCVVASYSLSGIPNRSTLLNSCLLQLKYAPYYAGIMPYAFQPYYAENYAGIFDANLVFINLCIIRKILVTHQNFHTNLSLSFACQTFCCFNFNFAHMHTMYANIHTVIGL